MFAHKKKYRLADTLNLLRKAEPKRDLDQAWEPRNDSYNSLEPYELFHSLLQARRFYLLLIFVPWKCRQSILLTFFLTKPAGWIQWQAGYQVCLSHCLKQGGTGQLRAGAPPPPHVLYSRQSASSLLSEQSSSSSHFQMKGMHRSFWHWNWSFSHSFAAPASQVTKEKETDSAQASESYNISHGWRSLERGREKTHGSSTPSEQPVSCERATRPRSPFFETHKAHYRLRHTHTHTMQSSD